MTDLPDCRNTSLTLRRGWLQSHRARRLNRARWSTPNIRANDCRHSHGANKPSEAAASRNHQASQPPPQPPCSWLRYEQPACRREQQTPKREATPLKKNRNVLENFIVFVFYRFDDKHKEISALPQKISAEVCACEKMHLSLHR